MEHHHAPEVSENESRLVDRFMFFTDAVFAIVLTLLILELRPPEEISGSNSELLKALHHVAPFAMAFAGSFALVGIFWIAHLQITRNMRFFDWPVVFANMLFLFVIAFMPFTTALAATQGWLQVTFHLYSFNIIAASAAQLMLFLLLTRDGGRLVGFMGRQEKLYRIFRAIIPGISFATALIISKSPLSDYTFRALLLLPALFLLAVFVRPKSVIADSKAA